jgi:hypothetical protein
MSDMRARQNAQRQAVNNDQRQRSSTERAKIISSTLFYAVVGLLGLALACLVLLPHASEAKECSTNLWAVGIGILVYMALNVARDLLIITAAFFSKQPGNAKNLIRYGSFCVDSVCLTTFLIWSITVLVSDETQQCKENKSVDRWIIYSWVMVAIYLAYDLVVAGLASIFCCLFTACLCLICFYGSRQARERSADLQRRIPIIEGVVKQLGSN